MPKKHFTGELVLSDVTEESPIVRGGGVDLEQFLGYMRASLDKFQKGENPTFGVTVLKDAQSITETRFRQAAAELGCGVSIESILPDSSRGQEYGLKPHEVRVRVAARNKKAAPNTAPKAANGVDEKASKGGGLPKVPAKA